MSSRLTLAVATAFILLAVVVAIYWKGRHDDAARARPKIEAAQAKAAVAGLETQGAKESAQRVEVVVRQRDAAAATVAQVTAKALTSEDADAPLDPDRAARLRNADRELCLAGPELVGCATDRTPD
ncbi:hypothetical protein DJ021_14250 [Phenylobacterium hankyongense]|uniref:Uncharacterized protein n=1 Tax=Phenylobacterium hankyongense TaxID=1813876 RepID=A0A328B0H5_9CAUL|nr:hypothetical protein [Phenylobacterium hankyongense]RAK60890.1 hypothetical protein DJ021_14250 [Phenylobacterium hankyongense]